MDYRHLSIYRNIIDRCVTTPGVLFGCKRLQGESRKQMLEWRLSKLREHMSKYRDERAGGGGERMGQLSPEGEE